MTTDALLKEIGFVIATGHETTQSFTWRKPMTELPDCPDCGVAPGTRHEENCDVARCPFCGQQDLMCTVPLEEGIRDNRFVCSNTEEPRVEGDMTPWTGRWPGEVECEELGWFARWTVVTECSHDGRPDSGESVSCPPDHPHAHHDLTRLDMATHTGELSWDRDTRLFVRKDET